MRAYYVTQMDSGRFILVFDTGSFITETIHAGHFGGTHTRRVPCLYQLAKTDTLVAAIRIYEKCRVVRGQNGPLRLTNCDPNDQYYFG